MKARGRLVKLDRSSLPWTPRLDIAVPNSFSSDPRPRAATTLSVLLMVAISFGGGTAALAQTLRSDAVGLRLQLRGPIDLNSNAELDLGALPLGSYDLITHGPRTATTRGRLHLSTEGLEMEPWSNATALLLPPGLVETVHHDRRGWVYLGSGAVATGLWWWMNSTADDAEKDIRSAVDRRRAALDPEEQKQARLDEFDARAEFSDDNRLRKIWLAYIGGLWVGSAIDSWLLTPHATVWPQGEAGYQLSLPSRSGRSAALRSALIPGAGQRSVGRDSRANFFLTSFLTTTAATLVAQDAYLSARRDVASAARRRDAAITAEDRQRWQSEIDASKSDTDDLSLVRWVLLGTAAYVYVWNVIDAYRVGRPEAASGPRFSLAPTRDGARFAIRWDLP